MSVKNIAKPPPRANTAREFLAGFDMLGVPGAILRSPGKGRAPFRHFPVMVMPGFGAGDGSTLPLRYFLERHGFRAEGWGLGINRAGRGMANGWDDLSERWDVDRTRPHNGEAEVPVLVDKLMDHVMKRSKATGRSYHLVGWSLGGYLAREVARDLPDHVQSVVTMGSPAFGGPKYTATASMFRARGTDLDYIEDEIEKRYETPITQPVTAIFSKRDGVVGWQAAMDHLSPNVNHVEVNVSHLGLGLNAKVWDIMLDALMRSDVITPHQSIHV